MTSMNLTVYIDEKLLVPDPKTGQVQVGNLALARKVGGVANVIFQSKTTSYFSNANLFRWEQSYQIGANQTPPQPSTFMKATTGPKAIAPGQMCDWSPTIPGGQPLQYMPNAKLADQGFLTKYPTSTGMFGTKNQPSMWYNSVWCSTGGGAYSCIYTDTTPPVPGMNYRAYLVEDNYQVSWETQNFAPGIFAGSWSTPWGFSIAPGTTTKFISWGFPPPGETQSPIWYDYGTTDPGQHDPSQAVSHSSTMHTLALTAIDVHSPFQRMSVGMRLGWTGNGYTDETKHQNASATFEYLSKSTRGWLNITNVYIGTYLSGDVGLRPDTSFGDYLPGETESDKIRFYMRALINNISPRFAPNNLDWNYGYRANEEPATGAVAGFRDFFKLAWSSLPPGSVLAAATASATFLQGLIITRWNSQHSNPISLEFETPVKVGSNQAMSKFKVSGLNADQYTQALNVCQQIVTQERQRSAPVPENPALPLPDNVQLNPNANASAEELFPSVSDPTSKLIEGPPAQKQIPYTNGQSETNGNGNQTQPQEYPYRDAYQTKQHYGYSQQLTGAA